MLHEVSGNYAKVSILSLRNKSLMEDDLEISHKSLCSSIEVIFIKFSQTGLYVLAIKLLFEQ